MKNKKIISCILAIILACSLFAGCSGSADPAGSQNSAGADVIEFKDMGGREIKLEGDIERVVAIGSALRLYTYVAGTDKLVGVEKEQQNIESGRPYIMANPSLKDLPIIGEGHPADPDPELIIQVEPDVIIAGDIMDKASLEKLESKTGVPVVIINCGSTAVFDPNTYQAIRIIGKVIGREDRAQEVVNFMENCKQELADLTKDLPEEEKPTVYVGGLSHKGMHGIESTAGQSPLLTAIGAKNVVDELGKKSSIMIDKEQLIEWDPDILIIDENGLSIVMDDYRKNKDFYNSLSAVKNGKVYAQLPYVSYYNNVETAIADIYYVGKILYPDAFKDIDPAAKADEIYNFLLGQPLYSAMSERFGGFKQITLGE